MEARGTNGAAIFDGQAVTMRRGPIGNQSRVGKAVPDDTFIAEVHKLLQRI